MQKLQSLFSEDTTKINPESEECSKLVLELGETSDSQGGC